MRIVMVMAQAMALAMMVIIGCQVEQGEEVAEAKHSGSGDDETCEDKTEYLYVQYNFKYYETYDSGYKYFKYNFRIPADVCEGTDDADKELQGAEMCEDEDPGYGGDLTLGRNSRPTNTGPYGIMQYVLGNYIYKITYSISDKGECIFRNATAKERIDTVHDDGEVTYKWKDLGDAGAPEKIESSTIRNRCWVGSGSKCREEEESGNDQ